MNKHKIRAKRLNISKPAFMLVIIAFIASGCAYFNSFYNTKSKYQQAERERLQSLKADSKPQGYKDAVEAGGRLIEMFPESEYIPEALFIMGQSYYWTGDYHKARRKFEELQTNYPDNPYKEETRLWMGRTLVQLKLRQEATSLLRRLISDTDDQELASGAYFALAELYYLDSLFVKAEEEFAKVTKLEAEDKMIGEAFWRAGEAAYRTERYKNAVKYLKDARKYSITRSLDFQVEYYYGMNLRLAGETDKSIKVLTKLLKDKRYYEEHGMIRVQYGLALKEKNNIEDAFEQFERTIENHGRSPEAARAYYEEALVNLKMFGDREKALELLEKAKIEKSRSEYGLKADTLLNKLNRVDELSVERRDIMKRFELTEAWVISPVDPKNDTLFVRVAYYDSLAIDSLSLIPLWSRAYRDSVILAEIIPDSTTLDSVRELSDSTNVDSLNAVEVFVDVSAGTLAMKEGVVDSLQTEMSNSLLMDSNELIISKEAPEILPSILPGTWEDAFTPAATPDSLESVKGGIVDAEAIAFKDTSATDTTIKESIVAPAVERVVPDTLEVLRLFDASPVLDSLAAMRSGLRNTRFVLGEILLFELDEPDSAKSIFRELADPSYPDSVRARATLALRYIAEEEKDSTNADSLVQLLAAEFPGTRYGEYATNILGGEVDTTRSKDELAFLVAEEAYLDRNDPQEAYSRFRLLTEDYPNSEWAPKALFAAAYISGHDLHDGQTAEELYAEVGKKYPSSDQAKNADMILGNLMRLRNKAGIEGLGDLDSEFEDLNTVSEDEIEIVPEIVGGVQALSSNLDARDLLPAEVIGGTGGEVLLRYVVDESGNASNFRTVLENPIGKGLARALISGLEEMSFYPGKKDGVAVAVRVERRYTLPLDAPPNVRPLPRRRR